MHRLHSLYRNRPLGSWYPPPLGLLSPTSTWRHSHLSLVDSADIRSLRHLHFRVLLTNSQFIVANQNASFSIKMMFCKSPVLGLKVVIQNVLVVSVPISRVWKRVGYHFWTMSVCWNGKAVEYKIQACGFFFLGVFSFALCAVLSILLFSS